MCFGLSRSFFSDIDEFSTFLESKKVKAAEVKAAIVYGEAGIGKSHLLCDISLDRIEKISRQCSFWELSIKVVTHLNSYKMPLI